jgi:hypothetical protein
MSAFQPDWEINAPMVRRLSEMIIGTMSPFANGVLTSL